MTLRSNEPDKLTRFSKRFPPRSATEKKKRKKERRKEKKKRNNDKIVAAGESLEAAVDSCPYIIHLDGRMCNFTKESERSINASAHR